MEGPAVVPQAGAGNAAPGDMVDLLPAAAEAGRSMVYLITFSALLPGAQHAAGIHHALRDVNACTREEIRDAVLNAVADPCFDPNARGGRPRQRQSEVVKLVVAAEHHSARPARHFHVALRLSEKARFLPYAKALLQRHGLASHWSDSHTQWWSAVRYLCVPTETKPAVDAEPLAWSQDGTPVNLFEASQEPFNAKALKARREKTVLQPAPAGSSKRVKTEPFTKLDFTALVIAEGLETKNAVMAYVQEKGSAAMQSFVHRHQRRITDFLHEASDWAAATSAAKAEQETDWALLQRLARGTCECGLGGCRWWAAACAFFRCNVDIDRQALAAAIRKVVCEGPSKTARVPMLVGPTNAGKSTIFNPLYTVFGRQAVFNKPKLGASCPLANLPKGKRFILFDDYRPVEYAAMPRDNPTIAVTTFLAMFQQQPFDVQVSQSFHDGHPEVVWSRGAAMTAKDTGLWEPFGLVTREDIRHMQARVVQFRATTSMEESALRVVPNCAESFARWILADSVAYASQAPQSLAPAIRGAALPLLPEDPEAGAEA